MKVKCIFLFSLSLFGSPLLTQAATYTNKDVDTIKVNNTGVYFNLDGFYSNPEDCGETDPDSSSNVYYAIDPTSDYKRELYSQLLAAKASGNKIRFGLSGCLGIYPKVYRVDIL
ncbi:hypothetical protein [Microbulbifer agarilyticus]